MAKKNTRLYKYVSLDYVVDILDNQRLYLSDGKNFNDPFEVTITDESGNTRYIENLHILSLTNSFQNKLIWSHYSNSHKSVCLTVEVPAKLVYPVCYSSKRVRTDSDLNQLITQNVKWRKKNLEKPFSTLSNNKKAAYIKDAKWAYENEYRIIFDKNDELSLIYENGNWYMSVKIKNVYLGVNFRKNDQKTIDEILSACKRNNINVTEMVLSNSDYSVKPGGKYNVNIQM